MAYIFLSVPILDKPEFKMVYSMYQAILSCKEHKVRLFVNENDSLISRVRNVHMSMFLNEFKDCDYFMSLDSDIEIVNCYNTNNIFSKLIAHNKDFVGGLYALKQSVTSARTSSVPLDMAIDRHNIPFDSGLIPMRWLSAGCWCIKRSAVEKMVASYPQLTYVGDDNVTGKVIHGLYNPDIFKIVDSESKKEFDKYLSEDWAFPVDPNTNILCKNFKWKPIKNINIGETIIAFDENAINGNQKRQMLETNVIHKVYKNLPKIKISTDDGESVITSAEHPWLIKRGFRLNGRKGQKNGSRMINPCKSYWERTDKLCIGDFIYKPLDNITNPKLDNIYYRYGYINGVFDGDGCISKHPKWNSLRISLRVCDFEIIERVSEFLRDEGIDHKVKLPKNSKIPNHRPMYEIYITSSGQEKFLKIYDKRENIIDHDSDDFCKGYMAGIFDAEGHYDGACVDIAQREFPSVVEKIRKYSNKIGFKFRRDWKRFRLTNVYQIHKFFMSTLPAISRKMHLDGQFKGKDRLLMPQRKVKITSIEKMKENGEMICLVTDSHTFIANGFASHNCERWSKIGGEIFADTSIVLRHIGKYAYSLWNVEVVAKKAEDATPAPQPKIIPEAQPVPLSFNKPSLPPAGWNLKESNS